jgi:hypothetical protein
MESTLGKISVHGRGLDSATRCIHYRTSVDIIAVKFRCCGYTIPVSIAIRKLLDIPPSNGLSPISGKRGFCAARAAAK